MNAGSPVGIATGIAGTRKFPMKAPDHHGGGMGIVPPSARRIVAISFSFYFFLKKNYLVESVQIVQLEIAIVEIALLVVDTMASLASWAEWGMELELKVKVKYL